MDIFEIGSRIQKLRKSRGMTQEQFAELIDKSTHYVYEIEHGLKNMSIYTLATIASALNVSLDYIVFGVVPQLDKETMDIIANDDLDHLVESVPLMKRDAVKNILKTVLQYMK